jgi:HlyD family secretion protein
VLAVFSSLAELTSVFLLGIFGAWVLGEGSAPDIPFIHDYLTTFIKDDQLMIYYSVLIIMVIIGASLISLFNSWKNTIIGQKIGYQLGSDLFAAYVNRDWDFFSRNKTSDLTSKIQVETERIAAGIVTTILNCVSKIVFVSFALIGLLMYSPGKTMCITLIFSIAYLSIFYGVKGNLERLGEEVSSLSSKRFEVMRNFFGGVRELIVSQRRKYYYDVFSDLSDKLAYVKGVSLVLTQIPRYLIEIVVFSSIVLIILVSMITNGGMGIEKFVRDGMIFAFVGMKLLPAFQQIYRGVAQVKNSIPAFIQAEPDLINTVSKREDIRGEAKSEDPCLKTSNQTNSYRDVAIEFCRVTFGYRPSNVPVVKDLSFNIKKNSLTALVGRSGSGKSTVLDLLLGLRSPWSGKILFCGLDRDDSVDQMIGYVPQNVFIANGSIRSNIAFGIAEEDINDESVKRAISMAGLEDVISRLSEGINSLLGDNGIGLSGGQIQRIGIARALYPNPAILIFDEPTSGLDIYSESKILESIDNLRLKKTILLVSHNLGSLKGFDEILVLEHGTLVESGDYSTLTQNCPVFRELCDRP